MSETLSKVKIVAFTFIGACATNHAEHVTPGKRGSADCGYYRISEPDQRFDHLGVSDLTSAAVHARLQARSMGF